MALGQIFLFSCGFGKIWNPAFHCCVLSVAVWCNSCKAEWLLQKVQKPKMFILWSFAKKVCQFPTGLQLVVHLNNPQTTVEELSNAVSSSPNPGLVIRKEISGFLLGFGPSGAVPGRGPWQPAWGSWSAHPWGVEGISECSSVTVERSV